jgi:hypothetical protein
VTESDKHSSFLVYYGGKSFTKQAERDGHPYNGSSMPSMSFTIKLFYGKERLARDKHSRLLRTSAYYSRKKFYSTGRRCLAFRLVTMFLNFFLFTMDAK